MIEGNLEDISLPGLLQLLAAESTKNYRLRINKGGQRGDVFVCEGHLLVATFGILEGLDALSEFLNWTDGEFVVEKLPSHFKSTIRSNINLNLAEPGCFADQCAFLQESNVGLNTEIVPSRSFGTSEWQEALHVQPLRNEDYAILGWITDGRTMRQAMREFQFDLKKTIGVLYRLLITRSVEVVRPTAYSEQSEQDELVRLATRELAKHTEVPKKTVTVEFHATDIGGARARPRGGADDTASGLRAVSPAAAAQISAGPETVEPSVAETQSKSDVPKAEKTEKGTEKVSEKPAAEKVAEKVAEKAAAEKPTAEKPAAEKPAAEKSVKEAEKTSSQKTAAKSEPEVAAKTPAKSESQKEELVTGPLKAVETKALKEEGNGKTKTATVVKTEPEPVSKESSKSPAADSAAKTSSKEGQASKVLDLMKDTVTESKPVSKEANLNEAISDDESEVKDNFKKQLKKNNNGAGTAAGEPEPNGKTSKQPHQTQDLPAMEQQQPVNPLDTLNTTFEELLQGEEVKELKELQEVEPPPVEKVLDVVASAASPAKAFDERRTDPLPLVSIDIERLLASTFQITNIGTIALTNSQLDDLLKQVLLDAERGKTLLLVLTDSNRSESAVLASYRYCLDRGYIEHTDPVMSLTVDLLLGRMELEQYLLQRRRITGDQLRDMVAIANRQGISLDKLLVAAGYMLPVDMDRVKKEKERFCPR